MGTPAMLGEVGAGADAGRWEGGGGERGGPCTWCHACQPSHSHPLVQGLGSSVESSPQAFYIASGATYPPHPLEKPSLVEHLLCARPETALSPAFSFNPRKC